MAMMTSKPITSLKWKVESAISEAGFGCFQRTNVGENLLFLSSPRAPAAPISWQLALVMLGVGERSRVLFIFVWWCADSCPGKFQLKCVAAG